ncbi:MAG: hypothetical protein QXK12_02035 [Candidatus Nezhaarchaeales archaeon]
MSTQFIRGLVEGLGPRFPRCGLPTSKTPFKAIIGRNATSVLEALREGKDILVATLYGFRERLVWS